MTKRMLPILGGTMLALSSAAPLPSETPAVAPARDFGLQGAPNFRDIGGYTTGDGLRVRYGVVYRSNKLSALTPADETRVDALHIASLVDLRAADERRSEPDLWLHMPTYVYDSPKPTIAPVMRTIMTNDGTADPVRHGMTRFYATMPDDYAAEFGALFRQIAEGDGPVVVHCTAGKDRTGVATAILLELLGVPRAEVLSDYRLTTIRLPMPAANPLTADGRLPPAARAAIWDADPRYLDAALDAIDRGYGSVDRYAEMRLGLSGAQISAMRRYMLEPVGQRR